MSAADRHSILKRRKGYFYQILDLQGICAVKHIEKHSDSPLIPGPRPFETVNATRH
jgi:hypothetical protein